MFVVSVDPGRVRPAISIWKNNNLVKTLTPKFTGTNGEKRLQKIMDFTAEYPEYFNPNQTELAIIESNTVAAGKETGCYLAGIWAANTVKVSFVSPIHVAIWASKFYDIPLTNIPRQLKKQRTKILVEGLTHRENLTFDEADSILNYYYWQNVKSNLRDRHHPTGTGDPDQSGPRKLI